MLLRKKSVWRMVLLVVLFALLVSVPTWSEAQEAEADDKDRVIIGRDLEIGSEVSMDDVVVLGGNLLVKGSVTGDALVIGGDCVLEPQGRIEGEAVVIGGRIKLREGAVVKGNRVEIEVGRRFFQFLRLKKLGLGSCFKDKPQKRSCGGFRFIYPIFFLIGTLAIGSLFLAFLPERSTCLHRTIRTRMGKSLLTGLLGLILFPVLVALLGVTLVGIPLIPILFMLLGFSVTWGFTGIGLFIGSRLTKPANDVSVKALAVGLLIFSATLFIPFIGAMLNLLFALLGFGAVLLSAFGGKKVSGPPSKPRNRTRPVSEKSAAVSGKGSGAESSSRRSGRERGSRKPRTDRNPRDRQSRKPSGNRSE